MVNYTDFYLEYFVYYFGKFSTLEAGILQNTDILLVMATIFEQLGLDNTNPFFLTWLYIPILPLFGDISSFLVLWILRSALLGGNTFPIRYLRQILLRGTQVLDKIVRNILSRYRPLKSIYILLSSISNRYLINTNNIQLILCGITYFAK